MNEQLLKTSKANVLHSRKKLRKTLWRGGGHPMSIRCVTLHSVRDRRGAASLRHRNSTEITVLVCEQKSNLM